MNVQVRLPGTEHWTNKGDVKLFLWNKCASDPAKTTGTILFVHGSSMASQPTFDLDVPGRPDSSAMEYFAKQGYDCWCVDMEGYGRSTKDRDNNAPISFGADDCFAAAQYIQKLRGPRSLPITHKCGEALTRCSSADPQDFVSRLCRLGGQSPYLSGSFWFILCSDMLPHRTPTWGISTRPRRGMKWKYSMSRSPLPLLGERRHSLQNCCPP